jgi:hypothetical protein
VPHPLSPDACTATAPAGPRSVGVNAGPGRSDAVKTSTSVTYRPTSNDTLAPSAREPVSGREPSARA